MGKAPSILISTYLTILEDGSSALVVAIGFFPLFLVHNSTVLLSTRKF
uniref:Uncharacterized protein n=1 Tax=Rhizophora mucronata TaxID=61149 RepID=A0A2P2K9H6_RHIMU